MNAVASSHFCGAVATARSRGYAVQIVAHNDDLIAKAVMADGKPTILINRWCLSQSEIARFILSVTESLDLAPKPSHIIPIPATAVPR